MTSPSASGTGREPDDVAYISEAKLAKACACVNDAAGADAVTLPAEPHLVTCPECGRNVLVTSYRRTRRHRRTVGMGSPRCPGGDVDVSRGWALIESAATPLPVEGTS